MEFILISGMSGAGKSKAASFMEDMGFFCVDNLPAPLIVKFAELGMAGSGEYERVVLVSDVRSGTCFDGLFQALLVFNLPYTFCKGLVIALITFVIYKRLSPILKGKK